MRAISVYKKKSRFRMTVTSEDPGKQNKMNGSYFSVQIIVKALTHVLVALWSIIALLKMTNYACMAMLRTSHKTDRH